MNTICLHWFWSTNPQKVRLALEELKLDYKLHQVDLARNAHQKPGYELIHPRRKVPALEIDGTILWESGACLLYLGLREQKLWPSDPDLVARAMNLLFLESSAFQSLAGTHFWNLKIRPLLGKKPNQDAIAVAHKKSQSIYALLDSYLAEGNYLLGDFSLVDCAFAPWLPWLNLADWPRLDAWRESLKQRPSWTACALR